ncbi:NAD(P)H-dependent flavin oxidoreductase [Nocardia sp. NBC_01388]|uniref:NAD(P)H-dependent flavin oxidoreductase n=1 Tax=Nocardia sp. NBC_01388 TaxID=2903596 RepID=UPI00324459E4
MSLPPILSERLRLPAVASPMFLVSGPELVIAQSRAGVVGSFPSLNARPQSQFREWLVRINEELAKHDAENPEQPSAPFAVNLIVHKSNDRLEEDLATIVEFQVPIVITSLGARADVNAAVHSYGGIVLHDVINNVFAHKAVERGADGLIAVAAGAGGHAGAQSPFALIQEIRAWFDGPLLLSGAIGHGRSVLAAQAAGADLAYIGSAFIATEEANAATDYKQMIVDSTAADIVYSSRFTGVHGNYLRPSITAVGLDPDNLGDRDPSAMNFGTDDSQTTEAKPWRDIWGSGQGIATTAAVTTTAGLVDRLVTEYADAKVRLQQL